MRTNFFNGLVFSLVMLLPATAISAEYVKCESTGDSRKYCNVRGIQDSDVELDRQLSKSSCIEGRSWGIDRRGIWVDNGCRADFRVTKRYGDRYSDRYSDRRDDLEMEREKLELEKERLELEKMKAQNQGSSQAQAQAGCPSGSRPGKCSPKQRKKGCKDFRTPAGLGCFTG